MDTYRQRRIPRLEISDADCILRAISLLDDPMDIVRACSVSHIWRRFVIRRGLCKRLFMERFPRVTHVAYEAHGRYRIIRLSDVLTGDSDEWGALEREHRVYSHLLQPLSKKMDCPRDCLLFPVGASSLAENILTAVSPVCTYPVGFSFLSSEEKSETRVNFLQYLEKDVCITILSLLNDPADVVRVGAVSQFWHQFVSANGFAKQLCLKELPRLSEISGVAVGSWEDEAKTSNSLKSDHAVYASLLYAIQKSNVFRKDCIEYAISASSTDNFPNASIFNTLRRYRIFNQPSHWSSTGQSNPQVPETLVYKLQPGFWLITEIDIQPFQAFWQDGRPIYSAGSVRFRIGHPRSGYEISNDPESFPLSNGIDDEFVWTYTSPEFSMTQENVLQPFKLPEPILCLDGYMQVEFLERTQRQESDGLYYIRVNHVRVVGRPLFPAFGAEIEEASGEMKLTYYPSFFGNIMECTGENENEPEEEMFGFQMVMLQPAPIHVEVRRIMLGGRRRQP